MKRVFWLWLSMAWVGAGLGADVPALAGLDQNQPLRVRQTILPIFPRALLADGITDGWARLVIDVDATGLLSDWLLVGHTRPEFGDAAINAVRRWEFEPMIINGHPSASQVAVAFKYEAKGVVIDITPGSAMNLLLFQGMRDKIYRPSTLREIDGIPVPQVWIDPIYPAELATRGIGGSATVEFYIDQTGVVRMPAVVKADFPELGHLLAEAVRQWKFDPPTQRGRPVLVHASQTVIFGAAE